MAFEALFHFENTSNFKGCTIVLGPLSTGNFSPPVSRNPNVFGDVEVILELARQQRSIKEFFTRISSKRILKGENLKYKSPKIELNSAWLHHAAVA